MYEYNTTNAQKLTGELAFSLSCKTNEMLLKITKKIDGHEVERYLTVSCKEITSLYCKECVEKNYFMLHCYYLNGVTALKNSFSYFN